MSKWIDVNDQLPDMWQRVLVSQVINQGSPSEYRLYFDAVRADEADDLDLEEQAYEWWWSDCKRAHEFYDCITHWRPLEEI